MTEETLDNVMELLTREKDFTRMEKYLSLVQTTYSKYDHYISKAEELRRNNQPSKPAGWGQERTPGGY